MQRWFLITVVVAFGLLLAAPGDTVVDTRAAGLPPGLSDQEFWQLTVEASEPSGYFRSENLTSNELQFQYVIPDLVTRLRPGGVYLGVGPEQNFTYISAVHPSMAVIFDIRRGNLLLHLMYKALFELSKDRAEFVSLLFSRPRPGGIGAEPTVTELFSKFADAHEAMGIYLRNRKSVHDQLLNVHHLPLSLDDLNGIDHIYEAFYVNGFRIRYSPTYDELMMATDEAGIHRSYLANDDTFATMKDLETRNLVVPVVGDFGGVKAIRRVAAYLKTRGATVGAFYLSNVEQYLEQDGKVQAFCRNVAALPLDTSSTFIRSSSGAAGGYRYYGSGGGFVSSLGEMKKEVKTCSQ